MPKTGTERQQAWRDRRARRIAALEAGRARLRAELADARGQPADALAKRFQKRLAKINAVPWLLATGEDYRFLSTADQLNWSARLKYRYLDEVVQLSTESPAARLALLEVIHLLKPPTTLFRPGLCFSVLKRAFWPGAPSRSEAERMAGRQLEPGCSVSG